VPLVLTTAVLNSEGTLAATGTAFGLPVDITVTGQIDPRRWGATLTVRAKTGALTPRDKTGTLTDRTKTGTLLDRRWEGTT
jgi:hypothetical protein